MFLAAQYNHMINLQPDFVGFLNISAINNLSQIIHCCGHCPGQWAMFSSRYLPTNPPDLHAIPVVTTKNILKHCPVYPEGQNFPQLRTNELKECKW